MVLSLESIAASLRVAFPDVSFASLSLLGSGFDSVAVETDTGIVFRVGTTTDAARSYAMEHRLLPMLRPHVDVPIPEPRWYAAPGDVFPHAAIGYPKVAGDILLPESADGIDLRALAEDCAAFLLSMHHIPVDDARAWGADVWDADLAQLRSVVSPLLRERFDDAAYRTLDAWWAGVVADDVMHSFTPMLRHCDMWYENLLVTGDPPRLAGVLDFGDTSIGDPAREFAALQYMGDAFMAHALDAYGALGGDTSPAMRHRVRIFVALREFFGLRWAQTHKPGFEVEEQLGKVAAQFGVDVRD